MTTNPTADLKPEVIKNDPVKVLRNFRKICAEHAEELRENRIGTHEQIFMNEQEADEIAAAIKRVLARIK